MTKVPPHKRHDELKQRLSPRAQQRIAERAGYTLLQLHSVWARGHTGDAAARQELESLLVRHHEVSKLLERFVQGAKRASSHGKLHAAVTKAVIFKKPESTWAKAKAKWLSINPGGLPTLGKRR